jgi:phosphotriesterase-related protein
LLVALGEAAVRVVLAHEHLALNFFDYHPDPTPMFDWTRDSLTAAARVGVAEVWDLTNQTFGRNLDVLARLADASEVRVVASTGHYLDRFHPDDTRHLSVAELARRWGRDLGTTVGSVNVAIIGEIATGHEIASDAEKRALMAAAALQADTGALIYTHTTFGSLAPFQLDVLLNAGAQPHRVIIGHADMFHPVGDLIEVLKAGMSVGIDTIGKESFKGLDGVTRRKPDLDRLQLVQQLVQAGYEKQIVLSSDLLYERGELDLNPETFGRYGYSYVPEHFLAELSAMGISNTAIQQMAGLNAQRLMAVARQDSTT